MNLNQNHYELVLCKEIKNADGDIRYGFVPLEKDYKITCPTMLVLGGNNCTSPDLACGIASIPAMMIKPGNEVNILSISYKMGSNIVSYADFTPAETRDLVKRFLKPMVSENNTRLPLDEACKNVRLITICAYCYGNVVKCDVVDEFNYLLKTLGYDNNEREQICKQLVCVAFAPMQEQYIERCTNLFIKSFDDNRFGEQYYHELFGKDYTCKNMNGGILVRNNNTLNLYTEKFAESLKKGYSIDHDNHNINLVRRTAIWQLYLSYATNSADIASQCMAYGLAMACANSIENYNSKKFIPFDDKKLEKHCNMLIEKLRIKRPRASKKAQQVSEIIK